MDSGYLRNNNRGLSVHFSRTSTTFCLAPDFLDTELSVFMQRLQVQEAAGEPGLAWRGSFSRSNSLRGRRPLSFSNKSRSNDRTTPTRLLPRWVSSTTFLFQP